METLKVLFAVALMCLSIAMVFGTPLILVFWVVNNFL